LATDTDSLGADNGDMISAVEFWRCYFDGRITRIRRTRGRGYAGELVRAFPTESEIWSPQMVPFSVPNDDLLRYDYDRNPKFSVSVYHTITEALSKVIAARLMQTETIPNISQLRLATKLLDLSVEAEQLPYLELRGLILSKLSNSGIELDRAINVLRELQPNAEDYLAFKNDGDLDKLHVERDLLIKCFGVHTTDPKICDALKSIIDNRSSEYSGTVELAIWALGRQNDKASIAFLIDLIGRQVLEPSLPVIERALQFICSGDQLITRAPDAQALPHWINVQDRLPKARAEWAAYDAGSVFWEKRLRCAVEWARSAEYGKYLESLGGDEVAAVRDAAAAASARSSGSIHVKIPNGTKLDLLTLKELFGAAAAALAPAVADLRGAVPAFGEQAYPGVALTLASTQVAVLIGWLTKQRTLRRSLQIEIVSETRKENSIIALSDERYDGVDAEERLAADLKLAVSEAEQSGGSES
jgi:hypothetical protein